jgi:hypothetical protein
LGTFDKPYTAFAQSVPAVATNGLIRIKGSTSLTNVTLNKAMRLEAYSGTVRIGSGSSGQAPMFVESGQATEAALSKTLREMPSKAASGTTKTVSPESGATIVSDDGPAGDDLGTNVIREGYVFEPVIPYTRLEDGRLHAGHDVPLALRLRSETGIDPSTLWQDIEAVETTGSVVTWQYAEGQNPADLWVLFRPADQWAQGDEIQVTAGATAADGDLVTASEQTFAVQAAAEPSGEVVQTHDPNGDPSQIATVVAGSALTSGVPNGLDQPYTIGPERVYDAPQLVWLPLPEGGAREDLQLYYYHPYGEDAGWYPAQNVIGWLAPEPEQYIEHNGARYVGLRVLHAGIVQFAAPIQR